MGVIILDLAAMDRVTRCKSGQQQKRQKKKKKRKPSLFPITWDSACTHTLGVLVGYKLPLKITRCSAVADAEHDAFFLFFFIPQ